MARSLVTACAEGVLARDERLGGGGCRKLMIDNRFPSCGSPAPYAGDGDMPHPGITKNTCNISSEVKGKDILLIDDIYTSRVYIDEDAIQALFDNGAKTAIMMIF